MDIFKIRRGGELIAYIEAERTSYIKKNDNELSSSSDTEVFYAAEFFAFWVSNKFRRQGIGRKLFEDSIRFIRNNFYPNRNFIVALSVEKESPMFNVLFNFFYNFGLKRGEHLNYEEDGHEILSTFEDLRDAKQALENPNQDTSHFIMCCRYDDLILQDESSN